MRKSFKKFLVGARQFFTSNVLWGVIIILLCIIGIILLTIYLEEKSLLREILIPILTAVIAGFLVSFVIDIKKQVVGIQELILESFTGNKFLEHLDEGQIFQLRKDALTHLAKLNYPGLQEELVEKDKDIFNALTNPYYEFFRETNLYHINKLFKWSNDNPEPALFKNVDVQYTVKTPHSENITTDVDLSISKSILLPQGSSINAQSIEQIWKIKQFSIIIDEGEETFITEDLNYQFKDLSDIDDYYNRTIRTYYDGKHRDGIKGQKGSQQGIFVTFRKSVKVHINYDLYLPVEDNHYTIRLKYPTKSFAISCICNDDPNIKFYGELLGTFMDSSELKITHPSNNILTIEASNWLLPKNGVVIMLCEKAKKCSMN